MNPLSIEPIKLLAGDHSDTGSTGSGCFMNVIAYLNGEPQITDKSPCVCPTVRPLAIWLNDFLRDGERQQLIPFIQRAMGSATDDKAEMIRRAWLAVDLANEMKEIATYAADAADAAARAATYAADAATYAATYATYAATYAADAAADAAAREKIIAAGIRFLDAALPKPDEPAQCVIDRAQDLVSLARTAGVVV